MMRVQVMIVGIVQNFMRHFGTSGSRYECNSYLRMYLMAWKLIFSLKLIFYRFFRNPTSKRLTSSGFSCCVQWPQLSRITLCFRLGTVSGRRS